MKALSSPAYFILLLFTDVNEANVNEIMAQYTQAYPPNDRELLLSWAGTHWKKDDPSVKLPKPRQGHILTQPAVDGLVATE
jgi:hypothetical protein